jgi:tRNA A37 threonylcarbamoyltransferase TsaD
LNQIFQPIINQIIELIKGQISVTNQKVKAILLVGGFGQNSYLKDSLREALVSSNRTLQPLSARTAALRGAAMMGLAHSNSQLTEVKLSFRRARKHYGLQLSTEFNARLHDGSKK